MKYVAKTAELSPCKLYRYRLTRQWSAPSDLAVPARWMTFIMLNPSTADHHDDDPTIRRCVSFAQREGCDGLIVVNLFALRATDPKELKQVPFPCSEEKAPRLNGSMIAHALEHSAQTVAAWGSWPATGLPALYLQMLDTLHALTERAPGGKLYALGTTKHGHPRHPLYVRADAPLVEWKFP